MCVYACMCAYMCVCVCTCMCVSKRDHQTDTFDILKLILQWFINCYSPHWSAFCSLSMNFFFLETYQALFNDCQAITQQ